MLLPSRLNPCLFKHFRAFCHSKLRWISSKSEEKSNKMVQVLNVAEKNDAAKNISELLSRGHTNRREGRSKFNKIYEFEYNLFNQNVKMAVTSVSGHLLALEFNGNYKRWASVNPITLFEAPVRKTCPEDYQNIKRTLEEETRKSQYLIIWTDCDREGENIGFEIIEVCRAVKPNIQVFRAKFSEITYQSVSRALQNLSPPDKNVSDAVDVRQELDLRIGASFTRFQTLRLTQVFPQTLGQSLISYGSCQFPTLGFVVERYKSIQEFISEPFWKLKVVWEPNSEEKVDFLWKRHHLFDELVTQILLEKCLENPEATVIQVQTKPKSKWRPLPLDTVELEKLASRKLRINAKETMTIAEKLYTQGFISYPRTETNIFPKELDLNPLVEMQTGDSAWGAFAQRVLNDGINPRQGKKSDQAHPPIHPTKYAANLSNEKERKLYEYIVRHFLACVSKDAQGFETVVEIQIQDEGFVASGLQVVARNYLEVYIYERWTDRSLPQFQQGQRFQPTSLTMEEGETSPPNLLTEADLIALMEKHGIGTDATHAEHIETIKSRMYVGLQNDGRFLPCSLGMGLVQGYDAMGIALSKPNLRAELERDLKRICEGLRNPKDVLREQIGKYRQVFAQAMEQVAKIDEALSEYINEERCEARAFAPESGGGTNQTYCKCPLCNQDLVLRRKKDNAGFFFSCMGYPDCKAAIWLPTTVKQVEIDTSTCPTCPTHPHLLNFTFSTGAYSPLYPDVYKACIGGCDTSFNEALGIRPVAQTNSIDPDTSRSSTNTSYSSGYQSGFSSRDQSSVVQRSANAYNQSNSTASSGGSTSHLPRSSQSRINPPPPPPISRPARPPPNNPSDSEIVCNCNETAILLTVRKEGPNTGRQFYKCPKPQGNCDFFLWADSPAPSQVGGGGGRENHRNPSTSSFQRSNTSSGTQCNCQEPARLCTVQKAGPNQGRQFYGCSKPRESSCNFFLWASDEATAGGLEESNRFVGSFNSNTSNRGRGRGRGGSNGTNREPKKRKCGICGQEGHIRSRCPNNED